MAKQKSRNQATVEPTSAGGSGGPAGKKQKRRARRNARGK
jgi:hypothetical protein